MSKYGFISGPYFPVFGLKNHLLRCWGWPIAKTASIKIGTLIRFMKFLSPEVTLYPYKSTIRPCMEYCCHVWAGAPSCYLELLDKLQKWICRIVGPSLAASHEPLVVESKEKLFHRFTSNFRNRTSFWQKLHMKPTLQKILGYKDGVAWNRPLWHRKGWSVKILYIQN